MDKNKQIEEMAHKLCKSKSPCVECLKRSRDAGIFVNKTDCECYLHAEVLSKYYQPKLPKGSVVLDHNEAQNYYAYKLIEPQIKGCLDRERELEKTVEYWKNEAKIARQEINNAAWESRKVAVKEFIQAIHKEYALCDDVGEIFYGSLRKDIEKIAKEFGVEL